MTRALLIGIALGALAVAYVLWPLLRPTPSATRTDSRMAPDKAQR